ncbi:hypothetical protein HWV62_38544 [Athelia sp. TMB]|nr:hypothetical protein HWV62_38544 [Athelia sp. TMB]
MFALSSVYDSAPLRQPRHHHHHEARSSPLRATNPRERYLAALAEAEAAEAEYVAAIAQEKALQRQREEAAATAARREAAAIQRQKTDALRRQAVFDALYAQDSSPYQIAPFSTPSRYPTLSHVDAQSAEEALIVRELERRRTLALRQQEEREAARVAAALEFKKREAAAAREVKLRQCSDEELLDLLSGAGRTTVRKAPSQEKLPIAFPPVISQLLNTIAEPPRHQALETSQQRPQSPADALLSAIFGGLGEQREQAQRQRVSRPSTPPITAYTNRMSCRQPRHCRQVNFAEQSQGPSCTRTTPRPASAANATSLAGIFNEGLNQKTRDNIYTTLQSLFGPNFSDNQARSNESTGANTTTSAPVPKVETPAPKGATAITTPAPASKAETSAPAPASKPTTASSAAGALKNLLQTRLDTEPDTEVRDTLQSLLGSIFNGVAQPHPSREPQAAPPSAPAPASNSELSLKEQLEARLHHDPNVEIHDTIKAIFASLAGPAPTHAPAAVAASGSSSTTTRAAPSASVHAEGKGKGKADATTQASTATSPTSKDVMDAMNTIHSIEAHFAVLASEFSFPTRLEFTPPSSRPSSPSPSSSFTSDLAYTAANAPVRYYEQALTALLSQLDAVESYGNDDVRKARKEVVARVERALEQVEREVRERFVQREARNAAAQPQAAGETVEAKGKFEEQLVEAEKPVSANEAAAEESAAVDEPTESVVESTQPPATIVADIETQQPKDEHTGQLAEGETTEETTFEPALALASPAAEPSHPYAEGPSMSSRLDGHLPNIDDDEATSTAPIDPQPAESLTSSVATVTPEAPGATSASSYPFTSVAATATNSEESEAIDTFLLPNQSPAIPKRPTSSNDEEELVVVDTHSEGDWSEVDA